MELSIVFKLGENTDTEALCYFLSSSLQPPYVRVSRSRRIASLRVVSLAFSMHQALTSMNAEARDNMCHISEGN